MRGKREEVNVDKVGENAEIIQRTLRDIDV